MGRQASFKCQSTDPILRKSDGIHFYYQTDHLGTPQQLIDSAGAVVHSREMRAFGEVAEAGLEDRWRFPGQSHNQETGFYYNYFRDYAPVLGRYVQSDPIGVDGGSNFFWYVDASPNTKKDPLGLFSIECEECDNRKMRELRDSVRQACDTFTQSRGPLRRYGELRRCIAKQCREATIVCETCPTMECRNARGEWGDIGVPAGRHSRAGGDGIICINHEIGNAETWGGTAIHEFAHECRWEHGDGPPIPGDPGRITSDADFDTSYCRPKGSGI